MLSATLLLIGAVLLAMSLAQTLVARLPLSPALLYLAVGWAAASLASPPLPAPDLMAHATLLRVLAEIAVLLSLFAIGLKIRVAATWAAWRVPVLLATSSMLWAVALATLLAVWLLPLAWPMALLLAAILAPTDPVLASDVQTHSEHDRDALRLSLTVEGALNDGTAFPLVMLALGLLGVHELGTNGLRWLQLDLLWSVGAGVALGVACGRAIGWALLRRLRVQPDSQGDELVYLGAIALVYGLSLALHASAFLAVFACGATLLRQHPATRAEPVAVDLGQHMQAFGARCERLAEVLMVLLVGAALTRVTWSAEVLAFALGVVLLVRPASVLLGLPPAALPTTQRRLVAWFGIRGVGSLFYLAFVLERGVKGPAAQTVISACLVSLAVSIALHGVSATPLMRWYQRRRGPVKAP
jgi:NhaP-type Na+/H+ or K+/H+ antiporter